MRYPEYLKLEWQSKAELSRSHRGFFLLRESIIWAGVMALVLTIFDATPWPLGHQNPFARLFIITVWAVGMSWWEMSRFGTATSPQRP
jgi:hypothetical protein